MRRAPILRRLLTALDQSPDRPAEGRVRRGRGAAECMPAASPPQPRSFASLTGRLEQADHHGIAAKLRDVFHHDADVHGSPLSHLAPMLPAKRVR